MASQTEDLFDGETSFMEAHDNVQTKAGNATWPNEFFPVVKGPKRHIAEVLLCMIHTLGLCCVIAGEYAMYIGGKLESHPDLITMYIAYYPQKWSSDISVLLQLQHTPAFSFDSLDFCICKNTPQLVKIFITLSIVEYKELLSESFAYKV